MAKLEAGDLYPALFELKELIENEPDQAKPYFYLGVIYSRMGQHDLALAYVERSLAIDGGNNAYANLKGTILVEQRQLRPALEAFEQALAGPEVKDPHKVWRNIGFVHRELRAWDDAIDAFRRALASEPQDAQSALALGKLFLDRNLLEAALEQLASAVQLQPDWAAAHVQLGIAQARAGRVDEGLAALSRAVEIAPEDTLARYNRAQILLRQGQVEDGRREMAAYDRLRQRTEALEHRRLELVTTFQSAIAELERGELPEAERLLRQVIANEASFAPAHYSLGCLLLRKEEYEAGISPLKEALRLDPLNAGAYFYLAGAYEATGNLAAALEPAQRAVVIFEENAEYHRQLGQIYAQLDRYEEAKRSLQRAFDLDPTSYATQLSQGILATQQGLLEEALGHLTEAAAIEVDNSEARLALGRTLLAMGRFDESLEQFQRVVQQFPGEVEPYLALAEALTRTRRFSEAESVLKDGLAALPESSRLHAELAALHRSQGSLEDSIAHFEQAMALAEGLATVDFYAQLAPLYISLSRIDDAIDAYRKILEREPGQIDAHGALGQLYLQRNQLPRAEAEFRSVLSHAPEHGQARAQLARTLLQAGRFEEAVAEARSALVSMPDHLQARYTLAMALVRAGASEEGRQELVQYQQTLETNQDTEHRFRELMALNQEALVKLEEGQQAQAVSLFRQAAEQFPDMALPQVNLGLAFIKVDEPEGAIRHLSRAVKLGFDFPEVHRYLAEQYEALDRTEESERERAIYLRLRQQHRLHKQGDADKRR